MGRKSDISSDKVAQIDILHKEGMSQRTISSKLRISQSSVSKCLARINELGNFKARKRSGRHRVTSRRTDSIIRRIVIANPTASATFIATQLPVADTPSVHTIRRRLTNDFKLKAYSGPARAIGDLGGRLGRQNSMGRQNNAMEKN